MRDHEPGSIAALAIPTGCASSHLTRTLAKLEATVLARLTPMVWRKSPQAILSWIALEIDQLDGPKRLVAASHAGMVKKGRVPTAGNHFISRSLLLLACR